MKHGHPSHERMTFRVYETIGVVQTFYARAMTPENADALIGTRSIDARPDGGFDVTMRAGGFPRVLTFYVETQPEPAPTFWRRVRSLFK